jgi:hypothetical protein
MRAEDRDPWDQWWEGTGRRELLKTLGLPRDIDADGSCAVAVALWWDGTPYGRKQRNAS